MPGVVGGAYPSQLLDAGMQVGGEPPPELPPPPPPELPGEGNVPPAQGVVGAQMLTCSPFAEVATLHIVPEGQPLAFSPVVHEEAQKESPWSCVQMPPPQSEFVRHPVHSGTVEVPPPLPRTGGAEASEPPGTPPPVPRRRSDAPAAQPADHPTMPPTSKRAASRNGRDERVVLITRRDVRDVHPLIARK